MLTKLWDLAFEIDGDDICLEQDLGGEVARVTLHRVHLRHLAEQAGLIPAAGHANADVIIARLGRQLRLLRDRIDTLDDWIRDASERGHEDLDEERVYSFATWELATEFVTDLDAVTQDGAVSRHVTQTPACVTHDTSLTNGLRNGTASSGNGPENGCVQPDLLTALDAPQRIGTPSPPDRTPIRPPDAGALPLNTSNAREGTPT